MTKKRWIATVVAICMVVLLFQYIPVLHASAATEGSIKSGVTGVYFRETPGGTPIKDSNGNTIYLNGGQALTIQDTSNSSWYKVTLTYNGGSYTGYVSSQYVVAGAAPTPSTPSGDADFEAKLSAQGFPDSYKPYLRAIHEKYPNWEFRAVQTGVDWNTLVANEVSKSGQVKNLIYGTSSYPHYNWRSTTIGYNIATDTWSSFDGKTWFAASDELVAYYMDPRTYLYENYIFAFESLSYQQGVQNETGVEAILKGTFMSQTKPAGDSRTYAQIIMEAAAQSGVSPYHIASRIRLEMGSTIGTACSGTNSSYPGIYNFYNIGANNSTKAGGAVANGLSWANKDTTYMRPWTNQYKAIVGGAQYLGSNYINVGQNTLYLQKFNVTANNTYNHQYMANIEAPWSESQKTADAYGTDKSDMRLVFSIPVYSGMPSEICPVPAGEAQQSVSTVSTNNYLKTLSVKGYAFQSPFKSGDDGHEVYSLKVNKKVSTIRIDARPVSTTAKVSGNGKKKLTQKKTKTYVVKVKAQSGDVRKYKIKVNRRK